MHQKQPPAKAATASPAAGGSAWRVASSDRAAVAPSARSAAAPQSIALKVIVCLPGPAPPPPRLTRWRLR